MSEKIYVGKGKTVGNFGDIRLNICTHNFNGEKLFEPNEKGWFPRLILSKMKQPDKKGNEYTIYIDNFVPNAQKNITQKIDEDLPF